MGIVHYGTLLLLYITETLRSFFSFRLRAVKLIHGYLINHHSMNRISSKRHLNDMITSVRSNELVNKLCKYKENSRFQRLYIFLSACIKFPVKLGYSNTRASV